MIWQPDLVTSESDVGAHLVGAYGLFWERHLIDWHPGAGKSWQMLGRRGVNAPGLRLCDFREAAGVYLLYDDYGPQYTGVARGGGGLGARLKQHHVREPHSIGWTRFSWFSFDLVVADHAELRGWSKIDWRSDSFSVDVDVASRDVEALLIKVLGLRSQNQMQFLNAYAWNQLTPWDAQDMEKRKGVDAKGFTYSYWDQW